MPDTIVYDSPAEREAIDVLRRALRREFDRWLWEGANPEAQSTHIDAMPNSTTSIIPPSRLIELILTTRGTK